MNDLPRLPHGAVVTVGTFDGVHQGHLGVVAEVVRRAKGRGAAAVVVTFEPHPLAILRPATAPLRLTTAAERAAVLAQTELDFLVVLGFNPALAALEPRAFVTQVLLDRCQMVELVVGYDHGFGRGRSGDLDFLRAFGVERGFDVLAMGPVTGATGEVVSSSAIRAAVAAGDFNRAQAALGRPYRLCGVVERGDQRGRTIGVPTANLAAPADKLLPPDGVYAVVVEHRDGIAAGMMNQGSRPTVGDGRRLLEAHLFDFDGDLYGQTIRVEWVARLRAIQRFESLDHLKVQLARDAEQARQLLATRGGNSNVV